MLAGVRFEYVIRDVSIRARHCWRAMRVGTRGAFGS